MCNRKGSVLNKHKHGIPQDAEYIGRGSRHGNKFKIGEHGTRDDVIAQHAHSIAGDAAYLRSLDDLRGKDVVCFCAPQACHGDTLVALAAMTHDERMEWARKTLEKGATAPTGRRWR